MVVFPTSPAGDTMKEPDSSVVTHVTGPEDPAARSWLRYVSLSGTVVESDSGAV
jgi:hypothetical protein